MRSPGPPGYSRAPAGSKLDPFKAEIHELLRRDAGLPGHISDAGELDNLIGTRFMLGFESDSETRETRELLRLDGADEQLRQRLLAYRRGRCLLRDLDGRVGAVPIELTGEGMLVVLAR